MNRVYGTGGAVENSGSCLRNLLVGARDGGQIGIALTVLRHAIVSISNSGGYDWGGEEWGIQKDLTVILASTLAGGVAGCFKDDSRLFGCLASAVMTSIVAKTSFESRTLEVGGALAVGFVIVGSGFAFLKANGFLERG